jgi:hypothetical protein
MQMRKIVYFVGAGLTKALEKPGQRIPLMNDFIRVMAEYADSDEVILTTLAELENAGVFQSKCPEAVELARLVVGKDRSPETKNAFKTAMMKRPPESIERLLANALARDPRADGPSGTALVIRFNYAINRFFSLLNWNVNWEPLERFLFDQFRRHPLQRNVHTFVSFNYDLILDRSVQKLATDHWNPFTGYGFKIRWYTEKGRERPCYVPVEPMPCDRIYVLKPHGSLNWLVPQDRSGKTGDVGYLLTDGPALLPIGEKGELRYCEWVEPKAILFSNNYGESMAVCVIPPTDPAKRVTLGFIERTRCMERKAIEEADEVYIIGWSIPRSDEDQRRLIAQAIEQRDRPISQVNAVNKEAGEDYFETVRQLFGGVNVVKHNNGFLEFVGG